MTSQFLAGVDEVGRGCLAGPVVSAAVILKKSADINIMQDSKKISPSKRKIIAQHILNHSHAIGIGLCNNHDIDRLNIHHATLLSMRKAVLNLNVKPTMIYIDGKFKPEIDISCQPIIDGDNKIAEISAASIIAKVLRDNEMSFLHYKNPVYGFIKHKGYGTKEHLQAIDLFGPSIFHRLSFSPLNEN